MRYTPSGVGTVFENGPNPVNLAFQRAVPEPSSVALLGIGALGLVGYGWRRRRRTA